jgi:hypothetical protein
LNIWIKWCQRPSLEASSIDASESNGPTGTKWRLQTHSSRRRLHNCF